MTDFSSSLYLGMHHPHRALLPWAQLTTGKPGLLYKPDQQKSVEHKLAKLMGYEQAILGTSTLHLFFDVFNMLSRLPVVIYYDEHIYPIARWGIERSAYQSIIVRQYSHHRSDKLYQQIRADCADGLRPVVVTDGFCPACSQFAPLAKLLQGIRKYNGYLLIDDTQALGIFGHHANPKNKYGWGGGGSLQWHQIEDNNVISISSLAKGFGVPVAVLAGSYEFINDFSLASETTVHTSPPSFAVIEATRHALQLNQNKGDEIRARLFKLIAYFKKYLAWAGLSCLQGGFPLQTIKTIPPVTSNQKLYQQLLQADIQTVLHRIRCSGKAGISFIITARHNFDSIKSAILILTQILQGATTDDWELYDEYTSDGFRLF